MFMTAIVTVIGAYLIGSINFAVIFSSIFLKKDVREFGSGNAGTTNMMRMGGALPGILTFVCDALKGFIATMMGKLIFDYIFTKTASGWANPVYGAFICGFICMIGHIFPIFFHFKGGKGVATCVGIFYVLSPISVSVALAVFALMTIITRIVSLSSLTATVVAIGLTMFLYNHNALFWPQAVFSIATGVMVFLKHSDNIKRLIAGEESKISLGRRK